MAAFNCSKVNLGGSDRRGNSGVPSFVIASEGELPETSNQGYGPLFDGGDRLRISSKS